MVEMDLLITARWKCPICDSYMEIVEKDIWICPYHPETKWKIVEMKE